MNCHNVCIKIHDRGIVIWLFVIAYMCQDHTCPLKKIFAYLFICFYNLKDYYYYVLFCKHLQLADQLARERRIQQDRKYLQRELDKSKLEAARTNR